MGGDTVNRGIVTDSTAHARVKINGQDVRPCCQRQRIAADPGAQIDDKARCESSGLVPGDRFRRGLLDAGRLDPHLLPELELRRRFQARPGQPNGGSNGSRRGQLSKPFQIRRPDRSNPGDFSEQAATGLGRQDPSLRIDVRRAGARGLSA